MSAEGTPEPEVVVTLDGRPRPAVVLAREGDRVRVRYRQAGSYEERWVPASAVVAVESRTERPPVAKIVILAVIGVLGLLLVLWPGSDKPLVGTAPTPTPSAAATSAPSASASPSSSPVPHATTAVLFGDSFTAGKGDPAGTRTALVVAASALHWQYTVTAQQGTGWTTTPSYAARLAHEVRAAPDVLVIQGGASDTGASAADLSKAVLTAVTDLRTRFPRTKIVLVGPVPMEQPPDQGLLRVSRTLATTAAVLRVPYVDAVPWISPANNQQYLSPQGFYPNPAGHAYLGARLAAALRSLGVAS